MLHANLMALHLTEVEFLTIIVLHCGNMDLFVPVTLTLSR